FCGDLVAASETAQLLLGSVGLFESRYLLRVIEGIVVGLLVPGVGDVAKGGKP
ncbi:hypothetical protein BHM03_00061654, partial [Ensete ventricosum]